MSEATIPRARESVDGASRTDPLRLVDVGARRGIDPRWTPFHRFLDVRAFEPDEEECARMAAQSWPYEIQFLPTALGARDGEAATLYITKQPGCSSVLRPDESVCGQFPYGENFEVVAEMPVVLNRMDSALGSWAPHALKIDTQGSELYILEGAGRVLDSVIAAELEVDFIPLYRNQPLFADVDAFMRSRGFTLRGLRRSYWRQKGSRRNAAGGQLVHGDALYLKMDRLDNRQGHMVLAAYRQYDLLSAFGVDDLVPEEPPLVRWAGALLRRIWQHPEIRVLADRMQDPETTDWHDPNLY